MKNIKSVDVEDYSKECPVNVKDTQTLADEKDTTKCISYTKFFPLTEGAVTFLDLVAGEYDRARQKHPPMHSLHEGYAVLLEEVDELWDEIKKKNPDKMNLLEECAQIAAMCYAMVMECRLMGKD